MIKVFNRKTKNYEIEKVAGDKWLKWTYESPIGLGLLEIFIKRKIFSKLYGSYCDTHLSRKKISSFVNGFNINMDESLLTEDKFQSYNEFFHRELKKEARPIDSDELSLVSPCDGKISVFNDIDLNSLVQVKGFTYSFNELIKDESLKDKYLKGTCLIFRLSPTDYHRFHFADSGICGATTKIKGSYYSVNPVALKRIKKLFCENKREWCTFKSDHFGDILWIEVGATCVGSIVQNYKENEHVNKGQEKGYFKYGGSTIILFIEKDKIKIDDDILKEAEKGYECIVKMGERVGRGI